MMKYVTEFIGTFVFLSVFLNATNPNSPHKMLAPFAVGVALTAVMFFGQQMSGNGHFNPAVSVMYALKDQLIMQDLSMFIVSQFFAAVAAKYYYDYSLSSK